MLLYILNIYNFIYQVYLNKSGKKPNRLSSKCCGSPAHTLMLTAKHLLLYLKAVKANLVSAQGKQESQRVNTPKTSFKQ